MITRRQALMSVAAGALTAGLGTRASAALPTVDMEAVVKAAQIDPRRADSTLTPGAKASVLLVEQALQARGLLSSTYVDGYFGTKTIDAYAAYQQSLGYTGLDASGLPGPTSLKTLGTNRYTVVNPLAPGSKITYRGVQMNTRTQSMLLAAEGLLGRTLTITQGSYNPGGEAASAGTHDGGGVLDISVDGMTSATRTEVARQLRIVGFAAWVRNPSQGDWPYHIHAVAISDTDLSPAAYHQAGDYYLGMNGLANRAPDDGPAVSPIRTWEEYRRSL
ncbi:MAG TPA: peptidoglycan-binding domain-containing protein [Phytomonospora sp.]